MRYVSTNMTTNIPKPLQPYAEALKEYEKQAIEILPVLVTGDINNDPLDIRQSKFGGLPFLPKDWQYPIGEDNLPMLMIAQINFQEIPFLEGFPNSGILQFYVEFGFNKDNRNYKVLYFSHDEIKKRPRTDFSFLNWEGFEKHIENAYYDAGLIGIYTLAFTKKIDRSSYEDTRFDFLFDGKTLEEFVNGFDPQGEEEEDMFLEVLEYLKVEGCKMNGYAQTEWENEDMPPLLKPKCKDDIQLLQIAQGWRSNIRLDCAINLFISPKDLHNENFEEAYLA